MSENQIKKYAYSSGTKLEKRMPMANVFETRHAFFPATNRPIPSGMHAGTHDAERISRLNYEDGSFVLVKGARRERHRRMLDFLIAYAPPIRIPGAGVAFFFDRCRAAEIVFGDKRQYTRVEKMLSAGGEMQRISISYFKPRAGVSDDFAETSGSGLVVRYERPYRVGKDLAMDAMIRRRQFNPDDLDGCSYVIIGQDYINHISGDDSMTLCYEPALPIIFTMDYVAASIARYALSNQYLGSHSLKKVLDETGVSTGSRRHEKIKKLRFGESAELLAQLGISIVPKGALGQLHLNYDSQRSDKLMSLWRKRQATG